MDWTWLVLAGVCLFYAFVKFFENEPWGQWSRKRKFGFLGSINQTLICVAAYIFDIQTDLSSYVLFYFCMIMFWTNFCFIPCGFKFVNKRVPLIVRNVFFLCMATLSAIKFIRYLEFYLSK